MAWFHGGGLPDRRSMETRMTVSRQLKGIEKRLSDSQYEEIIRKSIAIRGPGIVKATQHHGNTYRRI